MTQTELRAMVNKMVKEELYKILPPLIKEVTSKILTEQATRAPKIKRQPLRQPETRELSPIDKRRLQELIGYSNFGAERIGMSENVAVSAPSDSVIANIERDMPSADEVPNYVIKALTRNYRPLMDALKEKENGR